MVRMKATCTFRRRKAPSIIAVNKTTGKLVWEDNPVGDRILHGQWSSPSVGKVGDVVQVVMGQGDGWVRGYEAMTGKKPVGVRYESRRIRSGRRPATK